MPVRLAEQDADSPCGQVLESAQFINEHSQDVTVPLAGVQQAATKILQHMQQAEYSPATWKTHALNPQTADAYAVEWIFLIDLLNFSFWTAPNTPAHTVTVDGTCYSGYWALPAAVRRARNEGVDLTDAHVYSTLSAAQWAHAMRSDDPHAHLPLLTERLAVLHAAGRVLCERYAGRFGNLLAQCGSAEQLVGRVVGEFASFRDTHVFCGREVAVYKRAQILAADLWACFEGRGVGAFADIGRLTMFADYRVPQALCYFGALEYSARLVRHLRAAQEQGGEEGELPSGHVWEVEIRGNSVWAVECIRRHIRKTTGQDVSAVLIDFFMWDYAKAHAEEMREIPIHHTRSVYY